MARWREGARPPTIRVVATEAGVSTSTVSRVFSRPELISEATVVRVRAVAERLGYVPHATARALSTGRLGTIAVVVPDIANPFFPPLIRAVQSQAYSVGVSTILGDTDEDAAQELELLATLEQRTDGIVLVSSRLPERAVRERRHPLVLINRDIRGVPRVLVDSAPGVRAAVDHLVGLGHTRLAYVGGPPTSWSDRQRRTAVREQAEALGAEAVLLGGRRPDHEEGQAAVDEVLASRATGVVAFDDSLAQGLMAGMVERGLTAPRDYSVVGCDDVTAANAYPPLTSVHGRTEEAGRLVVSLLLDLVEGRGADGDARRVRHSLSSSLVPRASTGPAPTPPRPGSRAVGNGSRRW